MEISQIVVYSFIGLGFLLVLGALIYTRLIKPTTFSYTSRSWFVKRKINKIFQRLKETKKIQKSFNNVLFETNDLSTAAINSVYFSKNYIYFLSDCLYWNISDVIESNSKLEVLTKKNKKLDLPLDVQMFLKGIQKLKKIINFENKLVIIVPSLNKEFVDKEFNNIKFMCFDKIEKHINDLEQDTNNDILNLQEQIVSKMKSQKDKRKFFGINFKRNQTNKFD